MFISRLAKHFTEHSLKYALAGGYAVALHGVVRGTLDVDIIINASSKDYQLAERILLELGLVSRLPVTANEIFSFRKEYIEKRNLIAWSFSNPNDPTQVVDILIPYDLANFKVETRRIAQINIKLISRNDLIRIKEAAGRSQDLVDVAALKKVGG